MEIDLHYLSPETLAAIAVDLADAIDNPTVTERRQCENVIRFREVVAKLKSSGVNMYGLDRVAYLMNH